jgi:hypothetical protein
VTLVAHHAAKPHALSSGNSLCQRQCRGAWRNAAAPLTHVHIDQDPDVCPGRNCGRHLLQAVFRVDGDGDLSDAITTRVARQGGDPGTLGGTDDFVRDEDVVAELGRDLCFRNRGARQAHTGTAGELTTSDLRGLVRLEVWPKTAVACGKESRHRRDVALHRGDVDQERWRGNVGKCH